MKKFHLILLAIFGLCSVSNLSAKEMPKDTAYLNVQYVMTSHGMILSNTVSNRITYYEGENQIIKETVTTDMSMPDGNGSTTVNKGTETFTAIDGQVTNFHGHYIENSSTGFIKGEKDGKKMVFYGKENENSRWYQLSKENIDDIDFYVFFIDLEKQSIGRKTSVKKIYDIYELTLRDNHMTYKGEETIKVAGKDYDCKIIKFDYDVIKGTMWLTKEPSGNYILIKEEAVSKEFGAFNMDMTDMTTTKPSATEKKTSDFGF